MDKNNIQFKIAAVEFITRSERLSSCRVEQIISQSLIVTVQVNEDIFVRVDLSEHGIPYLLANAVVHVNKIL